jgi:hypothetical protein
MDSGQKVGQDLQRGAPACRPGRPGCAPPRRSAERGVVNECPVTDDAQVDPLLHAIGKRVQAGRRVLPVQPQVEGEVVAGAGAGDQERKVMLAVQPC